jgi:hypothetical protein
MNSHEITIQTEVVSLQSLNSYSFLLKDGVAHGVNTFPGLGGYSL